MKLKVCGLTNLDQIQKLTDLDTDYLGFIFYDKSPRFVLNHLSLNEISEINRSTKVGVFVNETVEKIINISKQSRLNIIQLHGDESADFILELKSKIEPNTKIIKAIRIGNQSLEDIQNQILNLENHTDFLLFDTDSLAFGGSGKTFDWQILNQLNIPKPYFLSGGVCEENINFIPLLKQKPFALDINSKFETEAGIKNIDKIKNFKTLINKLAL